MSGETTAPLTWISASEFKLDGLLFTCDTTGLARPMDAQSILIGKTRSLIDSLYKHLSAVKPQTMLEIGIAQGGIAFPLRTVSCFQAMRSLAIFQINN